MDGRVLEEGKEWDKNAFIEALFINDVNEQRLQILVSIAPKIVALIEQRMKKPITDRMEIPDIVVKDIKNRVFTEDLYLLYPDLYTNPEFIEEVCNLILTAGERDYIYSSDLGDFLKRTIEVHRSKDIKSWITEVISDIKFVSELKTGDMSRNTVLGIEANNTNKYLTSYFKGLRGIQKGKGNIQELNAQWRAVYKRIIEEGMEKVVEFQKAIGIEDRKGRYLIDDWLKIVFNYRLSTGELDKNEFDIDKFHQEVTELTELFIEIDLALHKARIFNEVNGLLSIDDLLIALADNYRDVELVTEWLKRTIKSLIPAESESLESTDQESDADKVQETTASIITIEDFVYAIKYAYSYRNRNANTVMERMLRENLSADETVALLRESLAIKEKNEENVHDILDAHFKLVGSFRELGISYDTVDRIMAFVYPDSQKPHGYSRSRHYTEPAERSSLMTLIIEFFEKNIETPNFKNIFEHSEESRGKSFSKFFEYFEIYFDAKHETYGIKLEPDNSISRFKYVLDFYTKLLDGIKDIAITNVPNLLNVITVAIHASKKGPDVDEIIKFIRDHPYAFDENGEIYADYIRGKSRTYPQEKLNGFPASLNGLSGMHVLIATFGQAEFLVLQQKYPKIAEDFINRRQEVSSETSIRALRALPLFDPILPKNLELAEKLAVISTLVKDLEAQAAYKKLIAAEKRLFKESEGGKKILAIIIKYNIQFGSEDWEEAVKLTQDIVNIKNRDIKDICENILEEYLVETTLSSLVSILKQITAKGISSKISVPIVLSYWRLSGRIDTEDAIKQIVSMCLSLKSQSKSETVIQSWIILVDDFQDENTFISECIPYIFVANAKLSENISAFTTILSVRRTMPTFGSAFVGIDILESIKTEGLEKTLRIIIQKAFTIFFEKEITIDEALLIEQHFPIIETLRLLLRYKIQEQDSRVKELVKLMQWKLDGVYEQERYTDVVKLTEDFPEAREAWIMNQTRHIDEMALNISARSQAESLVDIVLNSIENSHIFNMSTVSEYISIRQWVQNILNLAARNRSDIEELKGRVDTAYKFIRKFGNKFQERVFTEDELELLKALEISQEQLTPENVPTILLFLSIAASFLTLLELSASNIQDNRVGEVSLSSYIADLCKKLEKLGMVSDKRAFEEALKKIQESPAQVLTDFDIVITDDPKVVMKIGDSPQNCQNTTEIPNYNERLIELLRQGTPKVIAAVKDGKLLCNVIIVFGVNEENPFIFMDRGVYTIYPGSKEAFIKLFVKTLKSIYRKADIELAIPSSLISEETVTLKFDGDAPYLDSSPDQKLERHKVQAIII